jgi:hypothetical protein
MELYPHSPLNLHCVIINYQQGQSYLYLKKLITIPTFKQEQKDVEFKNVFLVSSLLPVGIT